ncbi:MAG: hypothetical protein ACYSSK_10590, partial [Planctomycetota bacterium]
TEVRQAAFAEQMGFERKFEMVTERYGRLDLGAKPGFGSVHEMIEGKGLVCRIGGPRVDSKDCGGALHFFGMAGWFILTSLLNNNGRWKKGFFFEHRRTPAPLYTLEIP